MTPGRRRWLAPGLLLAGWLLAAGWAVLTLPQVPFHPDESTHLFLSRDFDLLVGQRDPGSVTWRAAGAPPEVVRYRLLEAPLSRYLIGLGRALGGHGRDSLQPDWDWSRDWAENQALGALPDAGVLAAARLPAALLTALSLLPLFAIGQHLGGTAAGLGAGLLYCLSGVVWLHGRRAMSEGPLLFFSLLAIWAALHLARRPILAGVAAALAGAAKLTGLSTVPAVAVAVIFPPEANEGRARWRARLAALLSLAIAFGLVSWTTNPTLWADPVGGLRAMTTARQTLLASQSAAIAAAGPSLYLAGPARRGLAMLYHTYWAPLDFWDIPNYAAETRAAEQAYLRSWLNHGWRGPTAAATLPAGTAVLAMSVFGLIVGGRRLLAGRGRPPNPERRALLVVAAWTLATAAGLLSVTIAWQRYYLLLVPITCLWAGYGLQPLGRLAVALQARQLQRQV
jgi:4-amino-4-deoxy-L-arabinose transferase-like glycosyltransferase